MNYYYYYPYYYHYYYFQHYYYYYYYQEDPKVKKSALFVRHVTKAIQQQVYLYFLSTSCFISLIFHHSASVYLNIYSDCHVRNAIEYFPIVLKYM